ncbi:unnamed protein product [Moneuplotes crassus]|uniref:Uncharacterized protein n=1 Tax=Euplotes crassus TaxID=5936 RepID=A0AAD1Y650_EUPCR|nr:unnamed protein product [Moneuplotes crassus]
MGRSSCRSSFPCFSSSRSLMKSSLSLLLLHLESFGLLLELWCFFPCCWLCSSSKISGVLRLPSLCWLSCIELSSSCIEDSKAILRGCASLVLDKFSSGDISYFCVSSISFPISSSLSIFLE